MASKRAKVYKDHIVWFQNYNTKVDTLVSELLDRLVHSKYPINSAIVILHGSKIKEYVISEFKMDANIARLSPIFRGVILSSSYRRGGGACSP